MNITLEMFQAIYSSLKPTPKFLAFVVGLGRKLSSKDEDFMSCYSRTHFGGQAEDVADISNDGVDKGTVSCGAMIFGG